MSRWSKIKGGVVALFVALAVCGCGKAEKAYDQAMEYAQKGKYEKAVDTFKEAIHEDGKEAEYYIGYGMALNHLGRFEEAQKNYSSVLSGLKDDISKEDKKQLYYGYAVSVFGQGEYEEAAGYCEKALQVEYLDDMDNDIRFTESVCQERLGNYEEAIKLCETIVKEDKKDRTAYIQLAYLQEKTGKSEEAVKTYEKLIEEDEDDYDARFSLYEQYLKMGRTEAAEEILGDMIKIDSKKATDMLVIGRAYYYQGDYDSAKKYYEMSHDGNCKESLYYLGTLQMAQGDYTGAESTFLSYIKENKDSFRAEVYNQLAVAMMKTEDYEKAQSYIEKGMGMGTTGASQNLLRNQVSLYEKQKEYQKALDTANQYIKLYPGDAGMQKEQAFIQTRIK